MPTESKWDNPLWLKLGTLEYFLVAVLDYLTLGILHTTASFDSVNHLNLAPIVKSNSIERSIFLHSFR